MFMNNNNKTVATIIVQCLQFTGKDVLEATLQNDLFPTRGIKKYIKEITNDQRQQKLPREQKLPETLVSLRHWMYLLVKG